LKLQVFGVDLALQLGNSLGHVFLEGFNLGGVSLVPLFAIFSVKFAHLDQLVGVSRIQGLYLFDIGFLTFSVQFV
jgi:hypothetical protein